MNTFHVTRTIDAPVEAVFRTVSDIREFSKVLPHVIEYEFLTETQLGVGTRFRETRLISGNKAITELEVTEFVENDRVRLVADSHGAIWDTLFTVEPVDAMVLLTMTMEARAYKFLPRIMNRLFKRMIQKAVERDMDMVKQHCERSD